MGFWDTISKPFKAIGHAVESVAETVEHGAEEVWSGIGHVAEHVEKDVGIVLEHAEHDIQSVTSFAGKEIDKGVDAGVGAVNSMEMLPYLAAGVVVVMIMNGQKTSQIIDSAGRAIR